MKRTLLAAALALLVLFSLPAGIAFATAQPPSLEDLAQRAGGIVIGHVVSRTSHWSPDKSQILTDVAVTIDASLKGEFAGSLLLQTPGGEVDGLAMASSNALYFEVGEDVVLFLDDQGSSGLQLLGWEWGKYTIRSGLVWTSDGPVPVREFVSRVQEQVGVSASPAERLADVIERLAGAPAPGLQAPVMSSITPNFGPAIADQLRASGWGCAPDSTRVTVTGSSFGTTQGESWLAFSRTGSVYYPGCIESWSDTQIVARVPGGHHGASSGPVYVVAGGVASTPLDFTVTYSYEGGKWPGANLTYRVNPTVAGVAAGPALAAIQAAAATWNDTCSGFRFNYDGATAKTNVAQDLQNDVLWTTLPVTDVIVTDMYWYNSDPYTVIETDVKLNLARAWATDGRADAFDIQNGATTGLGFALPLAGLYGAADQDKSMYQYIEDGETNKRSLAQEDIDGIRYIYPSTACTPSPTATSTRTQTPISTRTSTVTPTPTITRTPTITQTPTRTGTPTRTPIRDKHLFLPIVFGQWLPPAPTSTPTVTATPIPPDMPGYNTQCQQAGKVQICASVSDASPAQFSTVIVYGRLLTGGVGQLGQAMNTTWHYRTSTASCSATTDDDGLAQCSRGVSGASSGYQVNVDVDIAGNQATTWFTPQ